MKKCETWHFEKILSLRFVYFDINEEFVTVFVCPILLYVVKKLSYILSVAH